LRDQTHIAVELNLFTISSGDTGAFLTAVLKCEECKEGKPSYVLTRRINTKDAAFFV
jgi:hypothetical protein